MIEGLFTVSTFQSTLPTRGSDREKLEKVLEHDSFQSTLPTRGSDALYFSFCAERCISIHAPHEGERLAADTRRRREPL